MALSFFAWATLVSWCSFGECSGGSTLQLRGFLERSTISPPGVTVLLAWYLTVVFVTTLGWRVGSATKPSPDLVARTWRPEFERRFFLLTFATAAAGVGYAYYTIVTSTSIIDALTSQTGNAFTNALSGRAGLETLRYATIIAAPVSIYLWRKKVIGLPFVIAAVGLLVLNSLIASRLALLMATTVYVAISSTAGLGKPRKQRQVPRIVVIGLIALIAFATLTTLNFVRNGNYYRAAGVTNPVAMNLYQAGSYLAVPAQVQLGVAHAAMAGNFQRMGSPVGSLAAIQPTFLVQNKVRKDDAQPENSEYGYSVSFASNFTTNSVFADVYSQLGLWGLVYCIFAYAGAGYLFARFMLYGPVVAGAGGVVAYCLLEVWRIQLLSQGIVIFLILLTLGCAFVASLAPRLRSADLRPDEDGGDRTP